MAGEPGGTNVKPGHGNNSFSPSPSQIAMHFVLKRAAGVVAVHTASAAVGFLPHLAAQSAMRGRAVGQGKHGHRFLHGLGWK